MTTHGERANIAMKPLIILMKVFGFWPASAIDSTTAIGKSIVLLPWFNITFDIVHCYLHTSYVTKIDDDIAEFTEMMSNCFEGYAILAKAITFAVQRHHLYDLYKQLVFVDYGDKMDIVRYLQESDHLDADLIDLKDAVDGSRESSFKEYELISRIYGFLCLVTISELTFNPVFVMIYERLAYPGQPEKHGRYFPYNLVKPFNNVHTPYFQLQWLGQIWESSINYGGKNIQCSIRKWFNSIVTVSVFLIIF